MDLKAVVTALSLIMSGYLFYVDQKRDAILLDLGTKYQAALAKAGTGAPGNDHDLFNAIREQVRAEFASRPAGGDCASSAEFQRLQELQIRLEAFDKKFNQALAKLSDPEEGREEEEKLTRKANKIRDKIISLCRK